MAAPTVAASQAHGAGPAGTVAAATATTTKAVATTPAAVIAAPNRTNTVTPPATAGAFDRSVANSLGK